MSVGVVASSLVGALICLMVVFGAPMYASEGGSEGVATVAIVAGGVGVVVSPFLGLFLAWMICTVDVHEVIASGREVNRRWSEWAADRRGRG